MGKQWNTSAEEIQTAQNQNSKRLAGKKISLAVENNQDGVFKWERKTKTRMKEKLEIVPEYKEYV